MHAGFLVRNTVALTSRWTTVHWMEAALRLGHTVWVFENRDLSVEHQEWTTRAFCLDAPMSSDDIVYAITRRTAPRKKIRACKLDVVLLRTAPLDLAVLALGMALKQKGVRVVNDPAGQLAVSHKSWLATQDLPMPATLVTSFVGEAHEFHERMGAVVLKPDRGSGGNGVHTVASGDHEALRDAFAAARVQRGRVVLQARVDGSEGERRLLWCDGEIVGGYLRQSSPDDFRHNLHQGATPHALQLSSFDRDLGPRLTPLLQPLGIRFVGLDVLDGKLLDVNAVNPGGTVYADALNGTRLGEAVVCRILQTPTHGNPS